MLAGTPNLRARGIPFQRLIRLLISLVRSFFLLAHPSASTICSDGNFKMWRITKIGFFDGRFLLRVRFLFNVIFR